MMSSSKIFCLLCFLSFFQIGISQTEKTKAPDAFANFLFTSELFDFAAEEYERLLFSEPENVEYLKRLIDCYQKTGNHKQLLNRLASQETPDKDLLMKRIDLMLQTNNAAQIPSLTDKFIKIFSNEEMNEIKFRTAIGQRSWEEASSLAQSHSALAKYQPTIDHINKAKYKNPKLAALLSTLVPGTGRFYAKDAKDGLFSILFIATSGFQSYRRFKAKGIKSPGGWIYGGIAFGFYVSNIYGSYQSAKYYNKKLDDKIYEYALPRVIYSN